MARQRRRCCCTRYVHSRGGHSAAALCLAIGSEQRRRMNGLLGASSAADWVVRHRLAHAPCVRSFFAPALAVARRAPCRGASMTVSDGYCHARRGGSRVARSSPDRLRPRRPGASRGCPRPWSCNKHVTFTLYVSAGAALLLRTRTTPWEHQPRRTTTARIREKKRGTWSAAIQRQCLMRTPIQKSFHLLAAVSPPLEHRRPLRDARLRARHFL